MSKLVKIGVCGATGKVGQSLVKEIALRQDCCVSGEFNSRKYVAELEQLCSLSDVIIDFSSPVIFESLVQKALRHKTKLVIGTTGLSESNFKLLHEATEEIAVFYSANMTAGIQIVSQLVQELAKKLDSTYDISIIESHGRLKKDAPSGTALMLGKNIASAKGLDFSSTTRVNASMMGEKKPDQIDIISVRSGGACGKHEILFANDHEIITISHQTLNRSIYASGAIQAALWIMDQKPGFYTMEDLYHPTKTLYQR